MVTSRDDLRWRSAEGEAGPRWIRRTLLGVPVFFSIAWSSHFILERNMPVGFSDSKAAFSGDLRMIWMMVTGRNREIAERIGQLREMLADG